MTKRRLALLALTAVMGSSLLVSGAWAGDAGDSGSAVAENQTEAAAA